MHSFICILFMFCQQSNCGQFQDHCELAVHSKRWINLLTSGLKHVAYGCLVSFIFVLSSSHTHDLALFSVLTVTSLKFTTIAWQQWHRFLDICGHVVRRSYLVWLCCQNNSLTSVKWNLENEPKPKNTTKKSKADSFLTTP